MELESYFLLVSEELSGAGLCVSQEVTGASGKGQSGNS